MSGVADLKRLIQLGLNKRRIVWTLHDMAPFTGFCHQSEDCRGFETGCKQCPIATRLVQGKIESQFKENFDLISNFPSLTVVAPSSWMASLAKSSLMFKGLPIQTIDNPISNEFFEVSLDTKRAKEILGLDSGIFVVAQIATDLLDQNKQVERCAELLAELGNGPDFNYCHLLIGANGKKLAERFPSTLYLGSLDPSDLASALMASDVLLSTSIAESAGLTILEAAALGKPSIVMDGTGSRNQIVPGLTGLVVSDWSDLKDQLLNIQSSSGKLSAFGKAAIQQAQKHRPEIVANKYVETYQSDQ
jgi:glycosyltransferase involved in cell wall biosynthesis